MNEWNWVAQISAAFVLMRMGCFANGMHSSRVPQRCALAVTAMAVGALAMLCAPIWGIGFDWPQALFAVCAMLYVWLDRRAPACLEGR